MQSNDRIRHNIISIDMHEECSFKVIKSSASKMGIIAVGSQCLDSVAGQLEDGDCWRVAKRCLVIRCLVSP